MVLSSRFVKETKMLNYFISVSFQFHSIVTIKRFIALKQMSFVMFVSGIALFTRTLDPLPDNMTTWIASKSKRQCYEPGDFVPLHHQGDTNL